MIVEACLASVLMFFEEFKHPIQSPPVVTVVEELKHRAFYADGKIFLRPDSECSDLAHEMAHHLQNEHDVEPHTPAAELDAHQWEEEYKRYK